MATVEKMNNYNPGIKCVVNTCHYYSSGDRCMAKQIEVLSRDAKTSEETDCGTFKPTNQGMK